VWQFCAAAVLVALCGAAANSAGRAFVADLVPLQSLGHGMAMYNATSPVGAMIGFVTMGYAVQGVGGSALLLWRRCCPGCAGSLGRMRAPARVTTGALDTRCLADIGVSCRKSGVWDRPGKEKPP